MLAMSRCAQVRCLTLYVEAVLMSTSGSPFGPRSLEYAQVDVFAEKALEGNMLGIFPDACGLAADEMQALARETNLSETTFILPREEACEQEHGVQVRIFTTQEELPFAGHPTLGTASWLYWNHPRLRAAREITLDLPVGPVTVRFSPEQGTTGVFATMQQPQSTFGQVHERSAIARVLGLTVADLDPALPVQTVSTGMAFCIVPLRSLEVAARLRIPQQQAEGYLDQSDAKFFYCITEAATPSVDWHARMQFYSGEDPATGSAAGCAIAYLVRHGAVPGGREVVIEQGVEIKRPSRLHVSATIREGSSGTDVFVGGRTIPVASGRVFLS